MRFEVRQNKDSAMGTVWDNVNKYHVASAIGDDAQMIVDALNFVHEHGDEVKRVKEKDSVVS